MLVCREPCDSYIRQFHHQPTPSMIEALPGRMRRERKRKKKELIVSVLKYFVRDVCVQGSVRLVEQADDRGVT